ncbi:MAG: cation:proton antiporter [Christensenellales bacterium]
MVEDLLSLFVAVAICYLIGMAATKIKLPAILGFLVGGMLTGPYALGIVSDSLLQAGWYDGLESLLECVVGLMIGGELVWTKLKKSGKTLVVTTLTQSLGTFLLVTAVFAIVFYFSGIELYLAVIFGSIALATAPAPALSIVKEFGTKGPVTDTLVPMAALDDVVGVVVFFTTISVVAGKVSNGGLPAYAIVAAILLPIAIGAIIGIAAGFVLRRKLQKPITLIVALTGIIATCIVGFVCNKYLMSAPILNFMMMGMAYFAAIANIVSKERLQEIICIFQPLLNLAIVVVIFNLGAGLDWHAIAGAGLYTFIYIVVRAAGKYCGAALGAKITKAPPTVQKYLGLTLLPHSGVSLVFTGIAVSVLSAVDVRSTQVLQGAIAAAAIINEIIAVVVSKKAFEWAGEISGERKNVDYRKLIDRANLS